MRQKPDFNVVTESYMSLEGQQTKGKEPAAQHGARIALLEQPHGQRHVQGLLRPLLPDTGRRQSFRGGAFLKPRLLQLCQGRELIVRA